MPLAWPPSALENAGNRPSYGCMFYLLCAAALLFAIWLATQPLRIAKRRHWLAQRPFPEAWRRILRQRVPLVQKLPADLQIQLKKHIQIFLAEKAFVGCAGLQITDEVRVVVAAQACLLLLNRATNYFPGLRQILVYPGPFVVKRVKTDPIGMEQEQRQVLAGESWQQGQVILSWHDSLEGAAGTDDGHNVVVHEFAHQLDQENGPANGAPPDALRQPHWSDTFAQTFEQVRRGFYDLAEGESPLFNDYALSEPAEFFAVACEVFFERGAALQRQHPGLYAEMAAYFRVDTAQWLSEN